MRLMINLFPALEHLYLPAAYLVQTDQDGLLTYLGQRATTATCASYNIGLDSTLLALLGQCERLSPKALEAHFKPTKSKQATPLAQLVDPKGPTRTAVEAYIFRHLDLVLQEAIRLDIPIALDCERKTFVKDVLLVPVQDELVPHLSFRKTDAGLEYRFMLGTDAERWPISSRDVWPLTNLNPAWIVVDYALFRVSGINGNMVRPFRQKDMILIPPDKVRMYFQQFITRFARRGHIEAEGFEVLVARQLLRTRLELVEDILQKTWLIRPVFEYAGTEFAAGDTRDHVTTVDFPDQSADVVVRKVSRDTAAEQNQLAALVALGAAASGRYYEAPLDVAMGTHQTPANSILWLTEQQGALRAAGFEVPQPEVEGKSIALESGQVVVHTTLEDDWFDVRGEVTVGQRTFPFGALIPYLKRSDPYFPLGDGTFFMIPEAWFARYADLAAAVTPGAGDTAKLPKTLFMLLDGAVQDVEISDHPDHPNTAPSRPNIDPERIDYQTPPELKAELRPYQLYGVKWLIGHMQHGFGACLADDMGLGKTLQTIAALLYAKSQRSAISEVASGGAQMSLFQTYREDIKPLQALVVLPASLVFNWQRELERFAPSLFVRVHTGPKRERDARVLGSHDMILTTYHTARQDLDLLTKVKWHVVVLDESQWIKNRGSELSKMVRALPATHKISLSGTPIENSLADLWSQMEFINPATLGSYAQFREQFQLPIERQQDAAARTRLFARVRPYFLRRTKQEVAPDLPPLSEQVFLSEMSADQRAAYDTLKSAVRNEILQLFDDPRTRLQAIVALTRLRQLANHPILCDADYAGESGKTDDVLAQLDTLQRSGHKVLIFSAFEQHLRVYRRVLEAAKTPFAWLTGDTPPDQRAAEIERFQTDALVQVFFCTLKAGGVGLNLTAADYVFLLDPWWNPAAEDQAIARAHRIGQQQPVTVLRFISKDSIEEKIRVLQARKQRLGTGLFGDQEEVPNLTKEDMLDLLA
jgi:SNF2-related domain/Helicase conserved C-terminal domain